MFAISIPIAFLSPEVAKFFWLVIWPASVLLERRYGKHAYDDPE